LKTKLTQRGYHYPISIKTKQGNQTFHKASLNSFNWVHISRNLPSIMSNAPTPIATKPYSPKPNPSNSKRKPKNRKCSWFAKT
jgi:hypothetical protein